MCRTQCVLALLTLYLGLAHSWDIAVGVGDQLILYTNGTKTNSLTFNSRNITALAYDEVHDMMLYVDKQSNNDSICGYSFSSKEHKCFIERNGRNIQEIAFDPPSWTIFFTDIHDNSINWIPLNLKPHTVNNVYGNRFFLISGYSAYPGDIAVDSCRGFIYWVQASKWSSDKHIIMRARFNGSEREVVKKNSENGLLSLSIDTRTQRIFYLNYKGPSDSFRQQYVNHADLNGGNENRTHYNYGFVFVSETKQLTVSKEYLYWVKNSETSSTVWQFPKIASGNIKPKRLATFSTVSSVAIASNYKIEDQIQGLQDCEALSSLISIEQTTGTEPTTEYTTEVELFCVHGVHVRETSLCECTPGYIGERCDVSACVNYCLQGNCSLNEDGLPTCSCNTGYTGERCEVSVCYGYCSNNGTCSLNRNSEPVCQCQGNFSGDRCEISNCMDYCIQGTYSSNKEGLPTCSCDAGYSGHRCEVYACHGYCLNDGKCYLNKEEKPVCQCTGNHVGSRCETVKDVTSTINNTLGTTQQI